MRAGLNTIQQTLTPEAANVLNMSIAEAGRRNHGQTTPLHVAATLLASPSGFLRQACIRSHPNSSHPLQCRALELCFSVALERLPAAQGQPPAMEPPISNALLAALKRAQAHQRRGCPEQQQQPLLAVKVELEQLIISILDDPSVSRVMREASFSSPAVKATIEQSLISQPAATAANPAAVIGIGFRPNPVPMSLPNRNMYLNPRLQQGNSVQSGHQRSEEIKRISDIFLKDKKRNPILVGESEPQTLIKELIKRIEKGQLSEGSFKNIEVIQLDKDLVSDKSQLPTKILELGGLIEPKIGDSRSGGVVIDLGDLKWLVEPGGAVSGGTQPPAVAEAGRAAVVEMAKLLARFGDGENGRIWLIGTATCETYLRCQIYHPSMENDWDLQAVPIAPRSPFPGMFPRLGGHGILNGSVESLNPLKNFQNATTLPRCVPESLEAARKLSSCPQCTESYEQELAKLVAKEYEKSSSEGRSEPARPPLPQWLQNVKVDNGDSKPLDQSQTRDQEMMFKQKSKELQRKWKDTCLRSHPHFHHNPSSERVAPTNLPMTSLINPKLLVHRPLQQKSQPNKILGTTLQLNHDPDHPRPGLINPKLLIHQPLLQKSQPNKSLGVTLQLNSNPKINQSSEQANSPPRSPVRTDLILGRPKVREPAPESPHKDRVKDLLGCISSDFQVEKFSKALDTDSYKKLLKGLMEKVWWQKEAASAVASAVTKCKEGNGRRRGTLSKGDTWLLFAGPDRVGKKTMASVISEQVCGSNPIMICLGPRRSDEELEMNFRGKTVLDRIVEAVRRNPFSVIMLEDIEEADMLVRGSIKRAMERGRLADSYGREISLGNVIFILTADWLPDNLAKISDDQMLDEKKLASISGGGWQLRLCIGQKSAKRQAEWLYDEDRLTKPRKELGSGLSLDLNLAADFEDDRTDGSFNSSDLTVDHEDDRLLENGRFMITSVPLELANFIDDAVIFKPVDIVSVRREIRSKLLEKFSSTIDNCSIELEDEALEKILGGVWLGRTGLEEWAEKVLGPSFRQMKTYLPSSSDDKVVVRLEIDGYSSSRITGDWLPDSIRVS